MIFSPNSSIGRALTKGDDKLAAKIPYFEAFDTMRKKPGEIKFRTSSLTDPHIAKLIQDAATKTGEDPNEILAKLKDKIAKIEQFKQYSPILYDTIAKDAVSQEAFDLIEHADVDPKVRTTFDVPTFMKLVKLIELEHDSQFFPLRAPGEVNYIFHISPILVPTDKPELMKFNQVNTAAASADGDFIFNRDFMQKLMDWAAVEGVKPKGSKYKSNGGPIPDQYAYIEFLIMHELMHYSYGDFSHGRRLKQYSPRVHNFASDFRTNYILVKNGYDQLPLGLFSDHINYDRQRSYDAMVKLVDDELKKLPKPLQDEFEEMAGMDDHPEPGEDSADQDGKGQGGDADDSKDNGQSDGDFGSKSGGKTQDQITDEIEKKLSKRKQIGSDEEAQAEEEKQKRDKGKAGKGRGGPNGGEMDDLTSRKSEIDQIVPRMNWKAMIRLMVSSSTEEIDTTYAKPSRRSLTGISVAAQTGKGALKPGERVQEQNHNKIALVIDTSGSMYYSIPTVLAEVKKLLKQLGKSQFPITLVYFADTAKWFQINLSADTAYQMQGAADVNKAPEKNKLIKGVDNLISKASTGGTTFGGTLQSGLASLASQGYNVMIFSDSDLLYGSNFTNLMSLWSGHKSNVFLVWDSLQSWRAACSQIGQIPKNMTHLPGKGNQ